MAKPNDFYVGILSFFAILLPGAIGVALLNPLVGSFVLADILRISSRDTTALWCVFLTTAYFLGHLLFLLGSGLDSSTDALLLIKKSRDIPGKFVQGLHKLKWQNLRKKEDENELAYQAVKTIMQGILKAEERAAINPYQWSRALLTTLFPTAATDVCTLEAESKFFRSLLVVLALAFVVFSIRLMPWPMLTTLLLSLPCFIRYYERRLKSTTQSYIYIISLAHLGKLSTSGTGK